MRGEISESGEILLQVPITVAVLIIIGITVLAIICISAAYYLLQHRNQCSDDSGTCNYSECKELTKKDLRHVIIFFATVLIFISVGIFTGDQSAMDYFSFASTITSIVLSVVAIIMTISSESKSEGVKHQIDKSVEEMNEAKELIQKCNNDMKESAQQQLDTFNRILTQSTDLYRMMESLNSQMDYIKKNIVNKNVTIDNVIYEEEPHT